MRVTAIIHHAHELGHCRVVDDYSGVPTLAAVHGVVWWWRRDAWANVLCAASGGDDVLRAGGCG
jgi:hypothetical protein